jgi:RHS repeat-associated protein
MKEASPGATPTLAAQNVWGITYVNDLVLRDDNAVTGNLGASPGTGSSTGLGERIYALHDANHDVTSITDASGNVLERFSYDPYGNVTVTTAYGDTATDLYNWNVLFQGGKRDATTGFYEFQHRDYDPSEERWMEEDPAGYVDGANTSDFEIGDPVGTLDFTGFSVLAVIGGEVGGIVGGIVGGAVGAGGGTAVEPGGGTVLGGALGGAEGAGLDDQLGGYIGWEAGEGLNWILTRPNLPPAKSLGEMKTTNILERLNSLDKGAETIANGSAINMIIRETPSRDKR